MYGERLINTQYNIIYHETGVEQHSDRVGRYALVFGADHVVQYALPAFVRVRVQEVNVPGFRVGHHVAVGHHGTSAAHERHLELLLERGVEYPSLEAAGHAGQLPYVQVGGHVDGLVELAGIVGRHPGRQHRLRHGLFDEQYAQGELLRDVRQHPEHGQTGRRMAVQTVLHGFRQLDQVLVQREHFQRLRPVVFARILTFLLAGPGFFGHNKRKKTIFPFSPTTLLSHHYVNYGQLQNVNC